MAYTYIYNYIYSMYSYFMTPFLRRLDKNVLERFYLETRPLQYPSKRWKLNGNMHENDACAAHFIYKHELMHYATVPAQTSLMIMERTYFHTIYNNKASGTLPMLKRRMILCTKDWFPGLFASLVDGSSKFYDLPPLRVREDYRNLGSIKTGIFVGGHPRNVLLTHLAPDKKNITTTTPNNPKIPTRTYQWPTVYL